MKYCVYSRAGGLSDLAQESGGHSEWVIHFWRALLACIVLLSLLVTCMQSPKESSLMDLW